MDGFLLIFIELLSFRKCTLLLIASPFRNYFGLENKYYFIPFPTPDFYPNLNLIVYLHRNLNLQVLSIFYFYWRFKAYFGTSKSVLD